MAENQFIIKTFTRKVSAGFWHIQQITLYHMKAKELRLQDVLLDQIEAFYDKINSFDSLPANQKLVLYRKELTEAESRILDLFDNTLEGDIFRLIDSDTNLEYISHYLNRRYYVLSKMFALHCSDSEVERIEKQNARLLALTNDTYEKTSQIFQHELGRPFKKDSILEVEGSLQFNGEGEDAILRFEDDSFYGSDFKRMIPLVAVVDEELEGNLPIITCHTIGDSLCSNDLDDGVTWAEGWLRHPKLDHIVMCYATHVIITHKDYCIPDFIRMNSFGIDVETKLTFPAQR